MYLNLEIIYNELLFRCLNESAGDVAFIKNNIIPVEEADKFSLLCKDGSRSSIELICSESRAVDTNINVGICVYHTPCCSVQDRNSTSSVPLQNVALGIPPIR